MDMVEVFVNPEDIWDCYWMNTELSYLPVVIAQNHAMGYGIFLTSEHNYPTLEVFQLRDNLMIDKYQAATPSDLLEATENLYAHYLSVPYQESDNEEMYDDVIDKRDEELMDAFRSFLEVVWNDCPDLFYDGIEEEEIREILDETLDVIGYDHGYSVYRPCFLKDNDDQEFFTMYPYDEEQR